MYAALDRYYVKYETSWEKLVDEFEDQDRANEFPNDAYVERQALKGSAATVISHLKVDHNNYELAYRALVETYDNQRLLANAYLHQVLSFKPLNGQRQKATKNTQPSTSQQPNAGYSSFCTMADNPAIPVRPESGPPILLGTLLADFMDARGQYVSLRGLLDSGSQHSYISLKGLRKLGLSYRPSARKICGIGETEYTGAKAVNQIGNSDENLNDKLTKFWEMEEIPEENH
ncbi:Protein of unknown function (DUF1759) [Nesidiocoris tenuis]|uniref:Peptidase A2 domain-containing protein n=1 Tax=Nesidiocoris tenuis TaxID=355587 RepID=A0ABN7AFY4_9HEMI|nr:Protein of unknown function (DUF1759) [Nesidiocoris tenuis]